MSVLATEISLEQFYAREETHPATELVDGEAIQKSVPTNLHSDVQAELCYLIRLALGGQKHRVRSEQNLQLSRKAVLIPDICVLRQPDTKSGPAQTELPLLCVEIISPSDRFSRTARKCQQYLDWGVSVCWILNPEERKAWIMTSAGLEQLPEDGRLTAESIVIPVSQVLPS